MVTVGDIIGGGFRLIRERIVAVAVWGLAYFAMQIGLVFAMRPFMQTLMASQASGSPPDPAVMIGAIGQLSGVYLLFMLALLILFTAALRAAVRPAESSFAYLRLGMDELRMLAVGIILWVGFFILYVVMGMVAALIGGILTVVAPKVGIFVIVLLFLLVFAALFVFYVRFSLAFPLTLIRRKIVIGEAWRLTRGHFWMLFGAYITLTLLVIAAALVVMSITQGAYLAQMMQAGFTPGGMNAAQQQQIASQFGPVTVMTVVGWVASALLGAFWIALGAGATGAAATGLLDDDFADIGAIYE